MSGLLGKKFPVPVARPYAPFFIAGGIIFYGINSLATTLANTSEYKNDPRNPARQAANAAANAVAGH